jgi:hypothetical protein
LTNEQEQAFRYLTSKLISPTILKYPNYSRKIVLTTDANTLGVGAVLSQGEIGKDIPVEFASCSLKQSE